MNLAGAPTFLVVGAVQRGLPFALVILLSLWVSPTELGTFAIFASVAALLQALMTLGMDTAIFRGYFAEHERRDNFLGAVSLFMLVAPTALGAAILLASLVVASLGQDGAIWIGLIALAQGIYVAATASPLALARARERFSMYAWLASVPVLIGTASKLVLIVSFGLDALGWVLGDIAMAATAIAISAAGQVRRLKAQLGGWEDLQRALRVGLPLVPHQLSIWGLNLADRWLIAIIVGVSAVGVYSLTYQLALAALVVATELNRAILPQFARAIGSTPAKAALAAIVSIHRQASVGLALAAFGFGGLFLRFFADPAYSSGESLLGVISIGICAYSLYYSPMNYVSVTLGKTRAIGILTTTIAITNILLNLILLPVLGTMGAALSTAISYTILWCALEIWSRRAEDPRALSWRWPDIAMALVAFTIFLVGAFAGDRPPDFLATEYLALAASAISAAITIRRLVHGSSTDGEPDFQTSGRSG